MPRINLIPCGWIGDARHLTSRVFGAAAAALLAAALPACDNPTFCNDESVPGLEIRVTDAVTGLPAVCGAEIVVISGDHREYPPTMCDDAVPDSLQSPWVKAAFENPGFYTVIIDKEGYAPWFRFGIAVGRDDCHVFTVEVEAELQPLD